MDKSILFLLKQDFEYIDDSKEIKFGIISILTEEQKDRVFLPIFILDHPYLLARCKMPSQYLHNPPLLQLK